MTRPTSEPFSRPVRVQLSRARGWRMPPNTKKIDRSTKWGNPFWVQQRSGSQWNPDTRCWEKIWDVCEPGAWSNGRSFNTKAAATEHAVARFICEVLPMLDLSDLRGKSLACWCGLDQTCHGDALLAAASDPKAGEL